MPSLVAACDADADPITVHNNFRLGMDNNKRSGRNTTAIPPSRQFINNHGSTQMQNPFQQRKQQPVQQRQQTQPTQSNQQHPQRQQQQQQQQHPQEYQQQHTQLILGNTKVFFPFQPYDTQRQYMESVIQALTTKQHALLESPTGTGKTLSLLCSTLAWLTGTGAKCMIYYTSRTHMQLAQAAKEMRRTAYGRNPAVVIGSRAQMCLNQEVKQQAGDQLINRACRNAIAKNACSYYSNYEQKLETMDHNQVNDIEELYKFGESHQCCPYYASKKLAETKASIVFMPYNYLLDTSLRKSTQLKLENSVIIFDEAHNIESALKDCVSGCFSQKCLETIQDSCTRLPAKINEALNSEKHGLSRFGYDPSKKKSAVVDEFKLSTKDSEKPEKEAKVNPIEELAEKLTNERLSLVRQCAKLLHQETRNCLTMEQTSSTDKVFNLFRVANISYTTSDVLITTLESMASFWSIAGVVNPTLVSNHVTAITSLCNVISLVYPRECLSPIQQNQHETRLKNYYAVYLKGDYETSDILKKGNLKNWELNLWCLHPAIGLRNVIDSNCINGPRSMIVTSGTLAPMRPIEEELETKFNIVKEFKHIISSDQLKMLLIGASPEDYSLASHHQAIQKDDYAKALGNSFLPIFKILPYGTLVFFQSYTLMHRVMNYWQKKSNIWRQMNDICSIFVEVKEQEKFLSDVLAFKKKIDSDATRGRAIYFGVCRGKLSEGINLEGNHCRSVILTGPPFPSFTDPRVVATKNFQEKKKYGKGQIWYSQQMQRALNQTLGRVIRSKDDFGVIILCDPRFSTWKMSMSEWTRDFYPLKATSWDSIESDLKGFFNNHGINIAESVTQSVGAFEVGFSCPRLDPLTVARMSPFSDASKYSPKSSRKSDKSRSLSPLSNEVTSTHEKRISSMLSQYTVSKEVFDNIKKKREAQVEASEVEVEEVKRPRYTLDDVFNSREEDRQQQPTTSQDSQANLSIFNQYGVQRPAEYTCNICFNVAKNPHMVSCNCTIPQKGCFTCIRGLDKKICGRCKAPIRRNLFKKLCFKSAFEKHDRKPEVVIPPPKNSAR